MALVASSADLSSVGPVAVLQCGGIGAVDRNERPRCAIVIVVASATVSVAKRMKIENDYDRASYHDPTSISVSEAAAMVHAATSIRDSLREG